MSISLKKAYRACLWLAEHKIGVPVNERQGQWDLTKENDEEFSWQRSDLVAALPLEYYEQSPYYYYKQVDVPDYHAITSLYENNMSEKQEEGSHTALNVLNKDQQELVKEEIPPIDKSEGIKDLANLILEAITPNEYISDDESCDDGLIYIDASNFIDGPLFSDEVSEYFERFSPNRNKAFYRPNNQLMVEMKNPSNVEKLSKLAIPTCQFDDDNYPTVKDNQKAVLASVMAHCTLTELLKNDEVKARGHILLTPTNEGISDKPPTTSKEEDIGFLFWKDNPIPNYEISAAEAGLPRQHRILMHIENSPYPIDENFISQCEFWYKSINISDSFESWHMQRVREIYPSPETATFKLENGKYLIQYGTDAAVEIKVSKGLTLIHKIMTTYNMKEFNEEYVGLSPFIHARDEIEADYLNYRSMSIGKRSKPDSLKKRIRKEQNFIYWQLCLKYKFMKETNYDRDEDEGKDTVERINKNIRYRIKEIESMESEYGNTSLISKYIDTTPEIFYDNQELIKKLLKIELDDHEKDFDNIRKNIENACDRLAKETPHFAKHIGPLKSESRQGIGYVNGEFYYVSNKKTKWEFK